jgi:hypothetical protein
MTKGERIHLKLVVVKTYNNFKNCKTTMTPPSTLAKNLNKREQHGESLQQPTMQDHCKTIQKTLEWNMTIAKRKRKRNVFNTSTSYFYKYSFHYSKDYLML